jgi:glycosyltransferase involved in cell wall biosynthesis
MNILLINHYAGSLRHGMEYRPFYLGREWMRMGHQVTIVAATASHVRTVAPGVQGALTRETVDGLVYHWLKTPSYQGNGIKRVMNILTFVAQLYRFADYWVHEVKPDLVISSSTHPLDNLPGHWIARRAGAKLIYEVHDLWPLSLIELGGMSTHHPFVKLIQWAENYAYRNADYVVSLLPKARSHMEKHGLSWEKFVYIPNGIDVTEWEEQNLPMPVEHQRVLESARCDAKLLIGYAGAHGLANALDTIIDAAHLLENEPVCFVLVGQGPEKARLESRCAKEGINNVLFLPPVAKATMPSLLAAMDVVYIGLKSEPLFRFGVSPNKLIDYMMAGKPVLCAIAAGNDPVAEAGCGISILPENPEAVVQAVKKLLDLSPGSLRQMGTRGRKYCLLQHDFRNLAPRFLNAVS